MAKTGLDKDAVDKNEFSADEFAKTWEEEQTHKVSQIIKALKSFVSPAQALMDGTYTAPPISGGVRDLQTVNRFIQANFPAGAAPGALVVSLFDGVNRIVRMVGFQAGSMVPSASVPATGTYPTGMYGLNFLTTKLLYVPVQKSQQIQISPDLTDTATYARSTALELKIYSDATTIGNNALSGTLNASAVSDVRSIEQFQTAQMTMNAVNKKDAVANVSVQTGVVIVQGPEVRESVGVVDTSLVDNVGNSGIEVDLLKGQVLSGMYSNYGQPYATSNANFASAWISYCSKAVGAGATSIFNDVTSSGAPVPQRAVYPPLNASVAYPAFDNICLRLHVVVKPTDFSASVPLMKLSSAVYVYAFYVSAGVDDPSNPSMLLTIVPTIQNVVDQNLPQYWSNAFDGSPISAPPGMEGMVEAQPVQFSRQSAATTTVASVNQYRIPQIFDMTTETPDPYSVFIGALVVAGNDDNMQMRISDTSSAGNSGVWQYNYNAMATTGQVPTLAPSWYVAASSSASVPFNYGNSTSTSNGCNIYGSGWLHFGLHNDEATGPGFSTPVRCYAQITQVDAIAKDIYGRGLLGPSRTVTWTNVAPGQNIVVQGRQVVEYIANGVVVPFSKSGNTAVCSDANLWAIATTAFNSTSKIFKRVYTGMEFRELTDFTLPALSLSEAVKNIDRYPELRELLAPIHKALSFMAAGSVVDRGYDDYGYNAYGSCLAPGSEVQPLPSTLSPLNHSGMVPYGSACGMYGSSGAYDDDDDEDGHVHSAGPWGHSAGQGPWGHSAGSAVDAAGSIINPMAWKYYLGTSGVQVKPGETPMQFLRAGKSVQTHVCFDVLTRVANGSVIIQAGNDADVSRVSSAIPSYSSKYYNWSPRMVKTAKKTEKNPQQQRLYTFPFPGHCVFSLASFLHLISAVIQKAQSQVAGLKEMNLRLQFARDVGAEKWDKIRNPKNVVSSGQEYFPAAAPEAVTKYAAALTRLFGILRSKTTFDRTQQQRRRTDWIHMFDPYIIWSTFATPATKSVQQMHFCLYPRRDDKTMVIGNRRERVNAHDLFNRLSVLHFESGSSENGVFARNKQLVMLSKAFAEHLDDPFAGMTQYHDMAIAYMADVHVAVMPPGGWPRRPVWDEDAERLKRKREKRRILPAGTPQTEDPRVMLDEEIMDWPLPDEPMEVEIDNTQFKRRRDIDGSSRRFAYRDADETGAAYEEIQ